MVNSGALTKHVAGCRGWSIRVAIIKFRRKGSNECSIAVLGYKGSGNDYQTRGQDISSPWHRRSQQLWKELGRERVPETRLDDDGNGGRRKVLAAASSGSIHGLGLSLCDPMAARPQVWPLLM